MHKDQILLIRDDMWVDDVINVMLAMNFLLHDDKIRFLGGFEVAPKMFPLSALRVR